MFDYKDTAKQLLQPGAVGIIPTDTVYGLVARAADVAAVDRLYACKPRIYKIGTVIAATIEQLEALGLKRRYMTAVEQYWPGSVSIIIPCADPKLKYILQTRQGLAVRIPDNKALLEVLSQTGPLVTTSANYPDEPTATTIGQAQETFGNDVDFYIDGGDLSGRKASTIIKVVDDAVEVIRAGAVTINETAGDQQ